MVVKFYVGVKITNRFMIERYSRKEMSSIWEDTNKYSIWLKIELAAAETMERN